MFQGMYYNFEIFHVKKKQVPIDTVECKEVVNAFAWEPVGSKFAFIHGESPRISVSFYKIGDEKITQLSEYLLLVFFFLLKSLFISTSVDHS